MAAYTTIDDPSAHFQVKTYTGNGTDDTAHTFDGDTDMSPDLIVFKKRNAVASHLVVDSPRGVTKYMYTDANVAEATDDNRVLSFDSDGFTLGTNTHTNADGDTYVAWCWKANGSGSSNTTGGINTTATSANTT